MHPAIALAGMQRVEIRDAINTKNDRLAVNDELLVNPRGPRKLVAEQEAIYAVECQGMIDQFGEALPPIPLSS
jgi:hypothetical protein